MILITQLQLFFVRNTCGSVRITVKQVSAACIVDAVSPRRQRQYVLQATDKWKDGAIM